MNTPTVVCVLREGREYQPEHVRALRDGVWESLDASYRFVCLSNMVVDDVDVMPLEYEWPGWWSKMELFRPDLEHPLGDILYFDLDTRIVGDLKDIAEIQVLTVLQDFYHPERVQSSLMYIPAVARAEVWERWIADPTVHMRRFRGDQEFLNPQWREQGERWQVILPGQVVSYKAHVKSNRGVVPMGARVVCFHGRPRPWQVKGFEV